MVCTCEIFCRLTHVKKHLQPPQKRTYEVDQTAKISDFILKQKNQTCSLSVITSGTVNLKSISFEIKHQLKAKHTLLLFSKLHLFSSDKSITQAVVKAFVLVKGPLSPLDVSVGSFFQADFATFKQISTVDSKMVATTQCLTLVLLFMLLSGNVFVRRTQSGPYSQPQLYRLQSCFTIS